MAKQSTSLPLPKDQPFVFTTDVPILIQHINYGNHLGHDSLVSLLHEARVRYLKAKNLDERSLIMVELSIQYKSEAFHGEVLQIEIAKGILAKSYFELLYRVTFSGRLVAEAVTIMAFFDYEQRKIVKIPLEFS